MISQQDIFTSIVTQTLRQGARSLRADKTGKSMPVCAYRGAEGRKCAVGGVLPDEVYSPDMDQAAGTIADVLEQLTVRYGAEAEIVKEITRDLDLLTRCQHVHDDVLPEDWYNEFARIARDFDLMMPLGVLNK